MPLPLNVKHYEFEPASSLLERLAIRNACPTTHIFCSEMGLAYEGVHAGKKPELLRLSELSGANMNDLTKWSPTYYSSDYYLLAGQEVSRHSLHRASSKVCPICIREDIAEGQIPARRVIWKLTTVSVCPVHLCYLIDRPISKIGQIEDCASLRDWSETKACEVPEAPALQTYVLRKLFSVPDKIWFDRLNVSSLLSLCTALARCVGRNSLKEEISKAAIEQAFSILQAGEVAFAEALSKCLPEFSGRQAGYYRQLRPMIEWLRADRRAKDIDQVCRAVAEVVHATCSVHRSSKILGGFSQNDHKMTFHQSRGIVDVGGRQLGHFLSDRGLATKGGGPFSYLCTRYLTAREVLFAAQEIKEFGTVKAATSIMQVSEDTSRALIKSGLLPTVMSDGPRGGLVNLVMCEDMMRKELYGKNRVRESNSPPFMPLRSVLNRHEVSLSQVMALMMIGALKYHHDPGTSGLIESISIDSKARLTTLVLQNDRKKKWKDVGQFLDLNTASLKFYAEQGHIATGGRGPNVPLEALPSVGYFYRTFVSKKSLTRYWKCWDLTDADFNRHGILPLIVPSGVEPVYKLIDVRMRGRLISNGNDALTRRNEIQIFFRDKY